MGLVVEMEAVSVLEMEEMVLVWDPRRDLLQGRKRGREGCDGVVEGSGGGVVDGFVEGIAEGITEGITKVVVVDSVADGICVGALEGDRESEGGGDGDEDGGGWRDGVVEGAGGSAVNGVSAERRFRFSCTLTEGRFRLS